MDTRLQIGFRIKAAREAKGYSQQKLAELADTSRGTIARYEGGSMYPSVQILSSIAEVLSCTTDYLLGRTERPGDVYWSDVPQELSEAGIDAVEIAKEALDAGLTKEDIRRMITLYKDWSGK